MTPTQRLTSFIEQLQSQLTPRALLGLVFLAAVVSFLLVTELANNVERLRNSVDDLQRERRLEQSLLNDQTWIEQAVDLQNRLEATHQDFWRGPTSGIIAAQLQGAIENAARNADLRQIRVNVEANPLQLSENTVTFEISLSSRDSNGQFLALFQELSREGKQLIINDFEWRRLNGSLRMRLSAPAIIENEISGSNL